MRLTRANSNLLSQTSSKIHFNIDKKLSILNDNKLTGKNPLLLLSLFSLCTQSTVNPQALCVIVYYFMCYQVCYPKWSLLLLLVVGASWAIKLRGGGGVQRCKITISIKVVLGLLLMHPKECFQSKVESINTWIWYLCECVYSGPKNRIFPCLLG